MQGKQIEVPSFVKKMDEEKLQKIVDGMANGVMNVYTQIKDENGNIVGFKRVYLTKEKEMILSQMYSDLKRKLNSLEDYNIVNALKKMKEIKRLRKRIEEVRSSQSYTMYSTGFETSENRAKTWKDDIAQTSRDIKEYKNIM
ncbi:MAG: hypothetical protein J6J17_04605 [Bacilli bacterium]|nr:hypothetical protein [Bacilli bacterium]